MSIEGSEGPLYLPSSAKNNPKSVDNLNIYMSIMSNNNFLILTAVLNNLTLEFLLAINSSEHIVLHLATPKTSEISVTTPVKMRFLRSRKEKYINEFNDETLSLQKKNYGSYLLFKSEMPGYSFKPMA